MRHVLRSSILLAVISCTVLSSVADEKKDAKKSDPAEKKALDQLKTATAITGKLSRVEGSQRYLTVTVAISIPVPTAASPTNVLAQLQFRQQLAAERSPANRQRLLLQYLQQSGGLGGGGYTIRTINKELEIQATDDMKVRTLLLPVDFDEKGRPKKYTAKEIKELKGPDPKLPGYTADFDSLKAEQTVRVYLAKKKEPPKEKGQDKEKKKGEDADVGSSEKPEALMVVILDEPKK